MSKVLVTGGAGYIGSRLVPKLLDIGEEVVVYDNLLFGKSGLRDVLDKIELIEGDIRNFPSSLFKDVDAVIHLAGLSTDPQAEYNPKATMQINANATEKLAKAAKEAGVKRFIFASSCSVYYTRTMDPLPKIKDETTPVSPTSPYSLSKHIAERKLLAMQDENFHPVILRKGTVYGYSPRLRYDLVVNTFVKDAMFKGAMTVNAGGEMFRPLVDIEDVVDAYIACLHSDEKAISGKIFNVVNHNLLVLSLAHKVRDILKDKKQVDIHVKYDGYDKVRSYYVIGEKIQEQLGFIAERNLKEAVLELWGILEKGKHNDYESPFYYNIEHMKKLISEGLVNEELMKKSHVPARSNGNTPQNKAKKFSIFPISKPLHGK